MVHFYIKLLTLSNCIFFPNNIYKIIDIENCTQFERKCFIIQQNLKLWRFLKEDEKINDSFIIKQIYDSRHCFSIKILFVPFVLPHINVHI